jgi:two-component system, OmpR family, phosphate regulon response regulator PhoB
MAKKIIIVEDDTPLYNLYRIDLELKGYSVSNVSDGNLAFEAIKTQQPDLVLLDLMLPGKNGLQILEELKTNDETKATRVIMLTNFGNEENVSKALELGAEDYIMKYNIVPSELSEKVTSLLGDSQNSSVKFTDM